MQTALPIALSVVSLFALPGAAPADVALDWSTYFGGANQDIAYAVAVDPDGNVVVGGGTYSADLPVTAGVFDAAYAGREDAFVAKLTPDGALIWSAYLGGAEIAGGQDERQVGRDSVRAVAVDAAGDIYVAGTTAALDFPATPGALSTTLSGPRDAFVAKIAGDGSSIIWATYLGGGSLDFARGIALQGDLIYVGGDTLSPDFPLSAGALSTLGTGNDAFVAAFAAEDGAFRIGATVGGPDFDVGRDVAVGAGGEIYVVGFTIHEGSIPGDFPTTPGAWMETGSGSLDGFVAKLTPDGSSFVYSTLIGGDGEDQVGAIQLDSRGRAHVAGGSTSTDLPVTGAFGPSGVGAGDAFVLGLDESGGRVVYGTYLAGRGVDDVHDLARGADGSLWVTGLTESADFPTTPDAVSPGAPVTDGRDGFVAQLAGDGSVLRYGTYLASDSDDEGRGIAVDERIGVVVVGETGSGNFPVTPGAFDRSWGGAGQIPNSIGGRLDGFIMRLHLAEDGGDEDEDVSDEQEEDEEGDDRGEDDGREDTDTDTDDGCAAGRGRGSSAGSAILLLALVTSARYRRKRK